MTVAHYENFPVASVLLPRPLREPVATIYAFARSADDFADEGDLTTAARLALLDGYQRQLDAIAEGEPIEDPLFRRLADVIKVHRLPLRRRRRERPEVDRPVAALEPSFQVATHGAVVALDLDRLLL